MVEINLTGGTGSRYSKIRSLDFYSYFLGSSTPLKKFTVWKEFSSIALNFVRNAIEELSVKRLSRDYSNFAPNLKYFSGNLLHEPSILSEPKLSSISLNWF